MENNSLTKAVIIEKIHEETKKNRNDIKIQVDNLLDILKTSLKKDKHILITGFGKFEAVYKKSRKGRNPHTKTDLILPERISVTFKTSQKLKDQVNQQ